jgi:hypothetical protein
VNGGTVAIIRPGVPADRAAGFVDCGVADTGFGAAPRMMLPVRRRPLPVRMVGSAFWLRFWLKLGGVQGGQAVGPWLARFEL